jgi:transmembrane sensor
MHPPELQALIQRWRLNEESVADRAELARMLADHTNLGLLENAIDEAGECHVPDGDLSATYDRILAYVRAHKQEAAVIPVWRRSRVWLRYAAAIVLLCGMGAYLWNTQKEKPASTTEASAKALKNDIAAGSSKAVLTLSDGRKVELTPDNAIIQETGIAIQNANGRLEYGKAEKMVFNTMSTPRGGQYQLNLPDGTNVWLNAESSITYPTAFANNRREVTITGEAYFEVTKNAAKPFMVKTPKEEITVLGTSFNVNAYSEEPAMKTSLVEGSVKVGKVVIQPGQACLNGKVISTDLGQDVAWKNGAFNFRNMDTEAAFRQLGRWYNVEIRFAGAVPSRLGGEIGRDLNLSQVVIALEDIGIRTRIEGSTLVVLPE